MDGSDHRIDEAFIQRFFAKVSKDGPSVSAELGPCWLWTASTSHLGYGKIGFNKGPFWGAHRVSYRIATGAWPMANCCHRCDTPACVNPAHLYDGTQAENLRDMSERGRCNRWDRRGVSNPHAVLTEELVARIRADHSRGVGVTAIARALGVSVPAISHVIARRTWAHIP